MNYTQKTLEPLSKALAELNLSQVCRDTGLHRDTIRGVRDGDDVNPTIKTLQILTDYLEALK